MLSKTSIRSFLIGLGVAVVATACAPDSVSGPQASVGAAAALNAPIPPAHANAPATAAKGPGQNGSLLPSVMRKKPLKNDITVSKIIGVNGGTLEIREAGLTVVFAPGALLQSTRITATADAGSAISYEFGPHGTQFYAPVTIKQDLKETTVNKKLDQANNLFGGYMPNGVADIVGDSVNVTEMHKSATKVGHDADGNDELKKASFTVSHFSGYILISGRR